MLSVEGYMIPTTNNTIIAYIDIRRNTRNTNTTLLSNSKKNNEMISNWHIIIIMLHS